MTLKIGNVGPTQMMVDAYADGKKLRALLDSGAGFTIISPRAVEKLGLPYRVKDTPLSAILADNTPATYGKGKIRLETIDTRLQVAGISDQRQINIMDLGDIDMLVGHDWLRQHNPDIDWKTGTVKSRVTPTRRVGIRETNQKIQCTPADRGIEFVKPGKIARIYQKDPKSIGVIWVRRVAAPEKEEPRPKVPATSKLRIPTEYEEFRELFEEHDETDLPERQEWDHKIELEEGAKLRPGPIYPLSHNQQEALKEQLESLLRKGYIREGHGPMASPILFVPKKNGKLRMCVDYRELNSKTRKNRYPLPLIQELMDKLQGSKWFTKFDIRDGFHRIRIAEGDEWKTAFKTRFGLYEYMVMPFGLTNAPATFQSVINKALHEYLDVFCTAYIDDVLIYTNGTEQEHTEHVKKVLRKLKQNRLLLHPDKCEFHVTKTDYLGFVISRDGVSMDPKKIEAVQDWKIPKTVKDVQAFLGFANFYRKFIRNYSKVTTPLSELTKKEVKWKPQEAFAPGSPPRRAFEELKRLFTTAPMLQMHNPELPQRVETDASDYALGAILSQKNEDGRWRPVYYHSRKFNGAELNYDVHDKELMAIIDAFEQWRPQLMGAKFQIEVYSDHQNLTSFTTTKKLNRRQVRWAELMADYDFRVYHRAGTLNGAADALSRKTDLKEEDRPVTHEAVLRTNEDGSLTYNQPRLAKIAAVTILEDQWRKKLEDALCGHGLDFRHWSKSDHESSVKATEDRPFVAPELRNQLVRELHESRMYGHPGLEEMVRRISNNYTMPNVRRTVQKAIGDCLACSKNKPKRHKPYGLLQPLEPPARPWISVTMDFIVKLPKSREPGSARLCDSILVIVERLTKYSYFVPTEESITAEEMAYEVTKALVANHGLPEEFITDRDKLFTSKYWNTLLSKLGVRKKLSTSFHPQTDGQTERTNQTLEQYLRMYTNKLQDNWVELLPTAQLAYNSTRSSTTGYSPYYANYGCEPEARRNPTNAESISVGADDKARLMKELHSQLSQNIAQRNLTVAKSANKKRLEGPTLKRGDKVFLSQKNLKTKRPSKKLDNLRIGPFEVEEAIGPVNAKLRLPKGTRIHPVFHKSLLEPAPPDAELQADLELEDEEYEVEEVLDLKQESHELHETGTKVSSAAPGEEGPAVARKEEKSSSEGSKKSDEGSACNQPRSVDDGSGCDSKGPPMGSVLFSTLS